MASEALLTKDALTEPSQDRKGCKNRNKDIENTHKRIRTDAKTQKVTKTILEGYSTRGCMCESKACLAGKGSFVSGNRRAEPCLLVMNLNENARDFVATRVATSVKVQMSCRDQGAFPFIVKSKITPLNQS